MSDISADMKRLIQQQNAAIASDPEYPLNDFQHKMKVGNIPTPEERAKNERELMAAANAIAGGSHRMPTSVLNESQNATTEEKNAALAKQRAIVNQLKQNQANQNPTYQSQLKRQQQQRAAMQAANFAAQQKRREVVLPIEREMINEGMKEFATLKDTSSIPDPGIYSEEPETQSPVKNKLPPPPEDDGEFEIVGQN